MDSTMNFGGPSDPKSAIMQQVRNEAAMTNARQLIEKVNEHCFDRCIAKPGTSISSSESTCLSQCMEKYMAAWNTVSQQYIKRIQVESGKPPGNGMF